MERVGDSRWRVSLMDKDGGRWSTYVDFDGPANPWRLLQAALDRLPDQEECAWCGRLYTRLLRDGVCGACLSMYHARGSVRDDQC